MPKSISGSAQTAIDSSITVPVDGDTLEAPRNEASIQTLLDNVATLENRINSIRPTAITDGSITTPLLADNAVTQGKIADNAIGEDQLANDSVQLSNIDTTNAGTAGNILARTATGLNWVMPSTASVSDGSITSSKLANDAVIQSKIANNAVGSNEIANNAVISGKVATNAIGSDQIVADAITQDKIADNAIGEDQLANDSVQLSHIDTTNTGATGNVLSRTSTGLNWIIPSTASVADGSITADKLATNSVTTIKINADAITNSKMADDAINTDQIVNDAITNAKVADDAINTDQIVNDAITQSKVADNAIGSDQIADNAVAANNIIANAIIGSKINANAISSAKIANSAITSSKLADNAIITIKITDDAITNAKVADDAINTDQIVNDAITQSKVADNAIGEDQIADDAIQLSHIDTTSVGASGNILSRTATGLNWIIPASSTVTDGSITADKLATNSVTTIKINADAVTQAKVADDAIGSDQIINDAIIQSKIADNAVGEDQLANDSVQLSNIDTTNTGATGQVLSRTANDLTWITPMATVTDGSITAVKLASNSVTTIKIDDDAVTQAKVADDAIGSNQIADDAIQLSHINTTSTGIDGNILSRTATGLNWITPSTVTVTDGSITSSKLAAKAVTDAKLNEDSVITAKVKDLNITGAKIANNTITRGKLSTTGTLGAGKALTLDSSNELEWTDPVGSGGITLGKVASQAIRPSNLYSNDTAGPNQIPTRLHNSDRFTWINNASHAVQNPTTWRVANTTAPTGFISNVTYSNAESWKIGQNYWMFSVVISVTTVASTGIARIRFNHPLTSSLTEKPVFNATCHAVYAGTTTSSNANLDTNENLIFDMWVRQRELRFFFYNHKQLTNAKFRLQGIILDY